MAVSKIKSAGKMVAFLVSILKWVRVVRAVWVEITIETVKQSTLKIQTNNLSGWMDYFSNGSLLLNDFNSKTKNIVLRTKMGQMFPQRKRKQTVFKSTFVESQIDKRFSKISHIYNHLQIACFCLDKNNEFAEDLHFVKQFFTLE